jgi:hypothetical protein
MLSPTVVPYYKIHTLQEKKKRKKEMARTKQCARKNKKIRHSDSTKFDKSGNEEELAGTEHGSSEILPEGEHQINNARQEKPHGKTNNKLTDLLKVTLMACESLASVVQAFKEKTVPIEIAQGALFFLLKTYFFKESKFDCIQANIHGSTTINFSVPPYVINNYTFSDSLQEIIEEAIITLDSYEFESHHKKYPFYKDISVITNLLDNGFHDNSSISFAFQQQETGSKPVAGLIYFPFREPKDYIMAAFSENSLKASFPLHSPGRSAPPGDSAAGKVLLSRDSYGTSIRDNLERSSYTIVDLDNNDGNNNNTSDATAVQTTLAERFMLLLQGRGSFLVDCRPAISLFGNFFLFIIFTTVLLLVCLFVLQKLLLFEQLSTRIKGE